jgi:hypothetical protein
MQSPQTSRALSVESGRRLLRLGQRRSLFSCHSHTERESYSWTLAQLWHLVNRPRYPLRLLARHMLNVSLGRP